MVLLFFFVWNLFTNSVCQVILHSRNIDTATLEIPPSIFFFIFLHCIT